MLCVEYQGILNVTNIDQHLIPYKIIFGKLPKALHPKAYIKLDPDD